MVLIVQPDHQEDLMSQTARTAFTRVVVIAAVLAAGVAGARTQLTIPRAEN